MDAGVDTQVVLINNPLLENQTVINEELQGKGQLVPNISLDHICIWSNWQ